jgi:hypothetical protein
MPRPQAPASAHHAQEDAALYPIFEAAPRDASEVGSTAARPLDWGELMRAFRLESASMLDARLEAP